MFNSNREGSELHIVVQDTGSSSKKAVQLEVDLVNVRPGASKGLLLHGRREQASRCETDVLRHNRLALTLASQFQRTSKGYAGDSLLRRSDATEVEALQGEVDRFAVSWLEGRGVVEARGQDVLDGDVRFGLSSNANGSEGYVDDVEAVPRETFVGANGLQGCYWDSDSNVVELDQEEMLARADHKLAGLELTFAFCWLRPMLAALATIAGMAKIAANFMMEVTKICL